MREELDMLGAEGLSSQYITLRVKSIDKAKLQGALGGAKGAAIPLALAAADFAPKTALDLALPLVVGKAKDEYGVDLEYQVTNAPPAKGENPPTHAARNVVAGAAVGAGGLWAARRFGLVGIVGQGIGRAFSHVRQAVGRIL